VICKAVAEGASAFYFYKVGKGELFSLVKSSPVATLLPLKNTLEAERHWGFASNSTSFL